MTLKCFARFLLLCLLSLLSIMVSTSRGCVGKWIVALSVFFGILVVTAPAQPRIHSDHERNVALKKPCFQSSGHVIRGRPTPCKHANNGNRNPYFTATNCFHNAYYDLLAFWSVDLGPNIYVHKLLIFGRNTHYERLVGSWIYFDKEPKIYITRPEVNYTFDFQAEKVRVIKILKRKTNSTYPLFINMCEVEAYACTSNRWGPGCENNCSEKCPSGDVICDRYNGTCLGCVSGKWGEDCQNDCGAGCSKVACSKGDGSCSCLPGWKSPQCKSCVSGKWGLNCMFPCGDGCDDNGCKNDTGTCDCRSGWESPTCESCVSGKWGKDCKNDCGAGCSSGTCNKDDGSCSCLPGWKSPQCERCVSVKWGEDCQNDCGAGCSSASCNKDNGSCSCLSGWKSPKCESCVPGKWGLNCMFPCGAGCDYNGCDKDTICICRPGWESPTCESCVPGKWGKDCENDCGAGCEGITCNKDDGSCNCEPGWESPLCENQLCECGEYECTMDGKYVYADFSRKVNVAIGKKARASTIMESSTPECLANDGYPPSESNPECVSTAPGDLSPFWKVNLGRKYVLAGIMIDWDDKMSQRSGIDVLLDNRLIYTTTDTTANPTYIPTRNLTGRVVKLQRRTFKDNNASDDPLLKICEVEVYNCRPGFYGHECEGICKLPVCENSQICSRIDGSCPKTEPEECSMMSIVEGCLFAFIVISLFALAGKFLPRADIRADEEEFEDSNIEEEGIELQEHKGINKAARGETSKRKISKQAKVINKPARGETSKRKISKQAKDINKPAKDETSKRKISKEAQGNKPAKDETSKRKISKEAQGNKPAK